MRYIGLAVVVSILIGSSLLAQNNRSAVSLTGNDAATCTVPDPCRTFDMAISKTNAESVSNSVAAGNVNAGFWALANDSERLLISLWTALRRPGTPSAFIQAAASERRG